jgi:excisionase family DNA binding protein
MGTNSDSPTWLDEAGASNRTSLSRSYLRQLRRQGRIPYAKIGRSVRYNVRALDEFMASHEAEASRERVSA